MRETLMEAARNDYSTRGQLSLKTLELYKISRILPHEFERACNEGLNLFKARNILESRIQTIKNRIHPDTPRSERRQSIGAILVKEGYPAAEIESALGSL